MPDLSGLTFKVIWYLVFQFAVAVLAASIFMASDFRFVPKVESLQPVNVYLVPEVPCTILFEIWA